MPRSKQIFFIVKISACLILFFIPISPTTVFPADVTLTWDRPNDSRVTGYEIFYGPAENDNFKSSPKEIIPSPEQTNCDIIGLIPGQSYAFAAKSYDQFGNKSVFSEVIFYDVPDAQDKNSINNNGNHKNVDDTIDGNNTNVDSSDEDPSDHGNGSDQSTKSSGGGGCFIHHISGLNTLN